jgi:hypothetical protein
VFFVFVGKSAVLRACLKHSNSIWYGGDERGHDDITVRLTLFVLSAARHDGDLLYV